ncbi:hypothetical protein D030_1552A, partial [Vibrio parahaemolyticus AQ3810]
MRARNNP